jgi:CRP/FNR family transcriptional regulator, polysaccharide utilization system transcription regulator
MSIYSRYSQPLSDDIVFSFFKYLSPEETSLIKSNCNMVMYHKRDNIFLQNTRTSHIMYLKTGLVKIYKEGRMGKTIMLNLDKDESFIGLMSVFGNDIHQYSASSVDQSEVYYIDINVFKQILLGNGNFALHIISLISSDGLYLFDKLIGQAHKQLPGRIADVLLYFSEVIYKNEKFTFPLTRRELAELAGTTKESFIRTLTEFKNDKIIELNGSEVEIKSMKIVKTLSELG